MSSDESKEKIIFAYNFAVYLISKSQKHRPLRQYILKILICNYNVLKFNMKHYSQPHTINCSQLVLRVALTCPCLNSNSLFNI